MDLMKDWLQKTIIGLNLCPFAGRPFKEGKVHIFEKEDRELEDAFESLLIHLESFKDKDTTDLVFFKKLDCDFEEFYHLVLDLEDYIEQFENSSVQVVCFHPNFRFEGVDAGARANFVNRSPYPTVHFLHSHEFDNLNLTTEEAEEISFKNEDKLSRLSEDELETFFPEKTQKKK